MIEVRSIDYRANQAPAGVAGRMEVDALLKRGGVYYKFKQGEIDQEIELSRQLAEKRQRKRHL